MATDFSRRSATGTTVKRAALALAIAAGPSLFMGSPAAQARDFGGHGGHGGGYVSVSGHAGGGHWGGHGGWGGGHWGHGWRGGWGPSWSVGFYAPYYGWGHPYYAYAPYPYYYDAPVIDASYTLPASAQEYHEQAYIQATSAPIGEPITWAAGGVRGTVTAVRDGHSGDQYCREFQQEVIIDGQQQQAYGAACQAPDGSWQVVPDNP